MTPLVQLRKEPRALHLASEGHSNRAAEIASTPIPQSLLRVLGLKQTARDQTTE